MSASVFDTLCGVHILVSISWPGMAAQRFLFWKEVCLSLDASMLLSLGGSRAYPWHEFAKALPGACGRRAESDHYLLVSENDAHSWRGDSGVRAQGTDLSAPRLLVG